eukprot:326261_1
MNVMPQNAVNAKKLKRKSNETFVCHQILLLTSTEPPSSIALAQRSNTLVLELRLHNESVSGLNCGFISSFDHEEEVLFFGGDAVFEIGTIFECNMIPFRWLNYRKYIAGIHNISNIA